MKNRNAISKERRTLIAEYLNKQPKLSTQALATQLFAKHRDLFPSLDQARAIVRYWRDRAKSPKRSKTVREFRKTISEAVRTPEEKKRLVYAGGVPEPHRSANAPFQWYDLPDGDDWLILGDVHIRFHDKKALETAITYGRRKGCKNVLLNGDILDCTAVSHWMTHPDDRDLVADLQAANELFRFLYKKFRQIWWKFGNHESRLPRYIIANAPELASLPSISLEALTSATEYGFTIVPPNCPIRHHALTIVHGHELRLSSLPVNPARGIFAKAMSCVLAGHFHRTSHHVEQTIDGTPVSCWSVGCLCDLHPDYSPLANRWNHGFAILRSGSEWHVENLRIIGTDVL